MASVLTRLALGGFPILLLLALRWRYGKEAFDLDTAAMNLHLAEISAQVAADAHVVMVLDQAGWHGAKALRVPDNISLLSLPPYSPELNPVENLWQFIKHNFLNARIFASYDAIVAACCDSWNRLRAIPGQIRSITTRDWAKTVIL